MPARDMAKARTKDSPPPAIATYALDNTKAETTPVARKGSVVTVPTARPAKKPNAVTTPTCRPEMTSRCMVPVRR